MSYFCIFRGTLSNIKEAIDLVSKDTLCHGILLKTNPQTPNFITYRSSNSACVDQAAVDCLLKGLTPVGGKPYVHFTPI